MVTDPVLKGPVLQPLVAVPGAAGKAIIMQCSAGEPAALMPSSAHGLGSTEITP